MILEEQLKLVIEEQKAAHKIKNYVKWKPKIQDKSNRILAVSGVRRCGKSTLLQHNFDLQKNSIILNFEDPRLESFEINDFYKIEKIENETNKGVFIFDVSFHNYG